MNVVSEVYTFLVVWVCTCTLLMYMCNMTNSLVHGLSSVHNPSHCDATRPCAGCVLCVGVSISNEPLPPLTVAYPSDYIDTVITQCRIQTCI